MAADLVRWLKSRGSSRRKVKVKDDENSTKQNDNSIPLKLSGRNGMALPPVPPPGFRNWPDISRDCANSPYHHYDEIPAYAIDTRLDILRDARLHVGEGDNGTRNQDCGSLRRSRSERCLQRSSGEEYRRNCAGPGPGERVPIRGTPWHQYWAGENPSDVINDLDQLDQWVSVEDNLEALSVHDNRIHSLDQEVPNSRPMRAVDTTFSHASDARVPHCRYPPGPGILPEGMSPYKADSCSDDSGVSSPSGGSIAREETLHGQGYPSPHTRVTGSSSRSFHHNVPSSHRTPASQRYPREYTHRRGDTTDDSRESGHEDCGSSPSELSDSLSSCMSPLEYTYYLRKTERNLQKTRGVRNIVKDEAPSDAEASHVADNSLDLTSVTSLSDSWSTYSDDEVSQLTSSMTSNSGDVTTVEANIETATVPQNAAENQSAFRPYESRGRRHSCSNVVLKTTNSPSVSVPEAKEATREMTLEERLSCRVTSGVPANLRNVSRTQTSRTKRVRPSSGVVTMGTTQGHKNSMLSDIMRINHDRQIMGVI